MKTVFKRLLKFERYQVINSIKLLFVVTSQSFSKILRAILENVDMALRGRQILIDRQQNASALITAFHCYAVVMPHTTLVFHTTSVTSQLS